MVSVELIFIILINMITTNDDMGLICIIKTFAFVIILYLKVLLFLGTNTD